HRAAPAPPLDAGVVIAAASVVLYGGRPLEAELRELLREREADEIRAALELLAAHAPDRGRRFDVPGVDLRARVEQIEEHGQALARGERRRGLPGTKTDAEHERLADVLSLVVQALDREAPAVDVQGVVQRELDRDPSSREPERAPVFRDPDVPSGGDIDAGRALGRKLAREVRA